MPPQVLSLQQNEDAEFKLVTDYVGYSNKKDITNVDQRAIVSPSQNVYINDAEEIAIRPGYTIDGQSNSTLAGIVASYDWLTTTGVERNLRAYNNNLEYRYVDPTSGNVVWRTLQNGWGSQVNFNFAEWYDSVNELEDLLLMVNGTSNAWMWSGGITTIASVSNATGIISTYTIASGGTNYQVNDVITVSTGAANATATVTSTNGGGTSGIVGNVSIASSGTGYLVGDVLTLTGGGANATLTVTATTSSVQGIPANIVVLNPGTTYSTGSQTPTGGHGSGMIINIVSVSNGAITAVSFISQGQNYQVGDVLNIPGGDGKATIQVTNTNISGGGSAGQILQFTVSAGGSGYSVAYNNTVTGGSGSGFTANINSVTGAGSVTGLNFTSFGSGYSVANGVATTGGSGSSLTVNITAVSANSITKQGTNTWVQDRFLAHGTRQVVINNLVYTYTGGEGTSTLTGITPDPTKDNPNAGSICHQALRQTTNIISATYNPGIIGSLNNQVFYADLSKQGYYISTLTDYTSFTANSPRHPGDGAVMTDLNFNPVGFAVGDDGSMYIWAGRNSIYKVVFTPSADQTTETVVSQLLKTNPGQGALSQSAIGYAKDAIVYVTQDKAVDSLSRIQNSALPMTQSVYINTVQVPNLYPLSDIVKNEFLNYSYTLPPSVKYAAYRLYVGVPSASKLMIYDFQKALWYPPWVVPVGRVAIIGGQPYIHSNSVPETYKLWTGTNDNGNSIDAIIAFSYRLYGDRAQNKTMDEWFTEGYISSNTKVSLTLNYDYGGSTTVVSKIIDGSNDQYIFTPVVDNSLGKSPLGEQPLGSISITPDNLSKFRIIHELSRQDFYEIQAIYETNQVDAQWKILATGGNVTLSTTENADIKA